ncbi:MAG: phosphatase PAP2 family protein [Candidatus Baltobacteraceae bacterium]
MDRARWWLLALAFFAIFAALGWYVSGRAPGAPDAGAHALRGEAPHLAFLFTSLGFWYAIVTVAAIVVLAAFLLARERVWLAIGILVSQFVSQLVVAGCKPLFHRIRPPDSIGPHLPDFSYPSGHAVTSIVFYASLTALVLASPGIPRPLRYALGALGVLFVAGIPWSRLALGAHYLTDVLGGLAFGLGWVCLTVALLERFARMHSAAK